MEQQSQLLMMIFLFYVLVILPRNVFHLPLCNLALTGMCRDVSWMIIELQARWMAAILLVFYLPVLLLYDRQVSV